MKSISIIRASGTGDGGDYLFYQTLESIREYTDRKVLNLDDKKVETKPGNNLANPDKFNKTGKMIRDDGSISGNNVLYGNTGFIDIAENQSLTINHVPPHSSAYNALFDADFQPLSTTITKKQTLTWVADAKYANFSIASAWDDVMVNLGVESITFEPFMPITGYPVNITDNSITTPKIADKSVTAEKLDKNAAVKPKLGKNKFNKETALAGYSIGSNGNTTPNVNYYAGDFIPVKPNTSYTKPNTQTAAWFGNNKEFISYYQAKVQVSPANAAYMRPTVPKDSIDTYQVEEGTTETSFEPFSPIAGYITTTPQDGIMETGIDIIVPDIIEVVEGDNLQIFHHGYIRAVNPYNYDIVVICSVGKNFPRYFEFKPTASHIGNLYPVTFFVKRNDTSIIVQKTSAIKVIAKMTSPVTNTNLLVMGASSTANGYFTFELNRRLTTTTGDGTPFNPTGLGLNNITFVGRKTGTSKAIPLEATGGWSWLDYAGEGRAAYRFYVTGITLINIGDIYTINGVTLTVTETNITDGSGDIRCTYSGSNSLPSTGALTRSSGTGDITVNYTSFESETFNPFWSNGKLDFVNYANQYCNGSIDVLIAYCGLNDIFAGRTGESLFDNYVKPFVRALHADFPNAKVIISSLPLLDVTGG